MVEEVVAQQSLSAKLAKGLTISAAEGAEAKNGPTAAEQQQLEAKLVRNMAQLQQHFSSEQGTEQPVQVRGSVRKLRVQKKYSFVDLQMGQGGETLQCFLNKGKDSEVIFNNKW